VGAVVGVEVGGVGVVFAGVVVFVGVILVCVTLAAGSADGVGAAFTATVPAPP
jgi:hypothetical protein